MVIHLICLRVSQHHSSVSKFTTPQPGLSRAEICRFSAELGLLNVAAATAVEYELIATSRVYGGVGIVDRLLSRDRRSADQEHAGRRPKLKPARWTVREDLPTRTESEVMDSCIRYMIRCSELYLKMS